MTQTGKPGATTDASAATRRLAAIRAAFPQRVLAVAPPGAGLLGLFWPTLLIAGVIVSMLGDDVPSLVTDLLIAFSGKGQVVAEQYLGPDSACWRTARIVTQCELELRARLDGGPWQSRTVRFSHLFAAPGSLSGMRVVALPQEPHWLTTDHALGQIGNRLICLLGFVGGLGWFGWSFTRTAIEGRRWRRRLRDALSGRILQPVMLRSASLGAEATPRRKRGVGLQRHPEGGAVRLDDPKRRPLFPLSGAGQDPPAMVLGVTAAGTELVMPVDRALRWVRLTQEERERLRRAAELDEAR